MTGRKIRIRLVFFGVTLCALGFLPVLLRVRRPEILSFGTISLALGCLAALLAGLLALACLKAGPDRDGLIPTRLDAAFAAAVVISLVSFLVSAKQPSNAFQPFLLFTGFLLYLLVRVTRRLSLHPCWRTIVRLIVGAAVIAAVQGLVQSASGLEMKGIFFNVNHFAMFLAAVLPLSLGLLWEEEKLVSRILWASVSGLIVAAVALSRCRTSYTASILVLALMLFVHRPRPSRRPGRPGGRAAARAVLVIGAAAVLVAAGLGLSFKQMSATGRLLIWNVSSRMVLDRPLAGVGFSNFPAFYNLAQGRSRPSRRAWSRAWKRRSSSSTPAGPSASRPGWFSFRVIHGPGAAMLRLFPLRSGRGVSALRLVFVWRRPTWEPVEWVSDGRDL